MVNNNCICNNCKIDKIQIDKYFEEYKSGNFRKVCRVCRYVLRKCKHKIVKTQCKTCGGSGFCIHNKRKNTCKDCHGSARCIHKKIKWQCKDCHGSRFCIHNKRKNTCKDCHGSARCIHKKIKSQCVNCHGSQICIHDKQKHKCIICTPHSKAFCSNCRLFQVSKKTNYLCSYCKPESSKRQQTRELRVKQFLETNNYNFIHDKRINLNGSCQSYRPDFLFDQGRFFINLECDEDAHKSYPYDCERIRENNIVYNLGLPCVFLRYNPDLKGVKQKTKHIVLKSYIDYYSSKECCDNTVEFLFYSTNPFKSL